MGESRFSVSVFCCVACLVAFAGISECHVTILMLLRFVLNSVDDADKALKQHSLFQVPIRCSAAACSCRDCLGCRISATHRRDWSSNKFSNYALHSSCA